MHGHVPSGISSQLKNLHFFIGKLMNFRLAMASRGADIRPISAGNWVK